MNIYSLLPELALQQIACSVNISIDLIVGITYVCDLSQFICFANSVLVKPFIDIALEIPILYLKHHDTNIWTDHYQVGTVFLRIGTLFLPAGRHTQFTKDEVVFGKRF